MILRIRSRGPALVLVAALVFTAPAAADPDKKLGWNGSIGLGIAWTEGTTDSFNGNGTIQLERNWERDRFRTELLALYGEADSDTNTNRQELSAEYRHYFLKRLYGFASGGFGRDTVQRVRWRALANAGPGYRWWEGESGEKRHFDTEFGVGYLHQEFLRSSSDTGNLQRREDARDDPLLRFAFEHANVLGEALEIVHTGSFLLPPTSEDEFIVRSQLIASVPIAWGWAFRNTFFVEYQNEPPPEADETTFTYSAGLEYKF